MAEKRQPAGGLGRFRLKRLLATAYYMDKGLLGVPADRPETAPLADLVAEIARAIRVDAPAQLLVSPYAEVAISGDTPEDLTLYVGAPFVLGLPIVELKTVLAHCMASLGQPHPALADALVRSTDRIQGSLDFFGPQTAMGRRYRRFLDGSAEARSDLARYADRAAAAMAGSQERAQAALIHARALTEHFVDYAPRYLVVGSEPLQDLYSNWLRVAAQPVPDWAVNSKPAVDPLIPAECVPLIAALPEDDNDTLVAAIDVDPDDAIGFDYEVGCQDVIEGAGHLLEREATPVDVVGLVADGRGAELIAEWDRATAARLAALPGAYLIESFLARHGTALTVGEMFATFIPGLACRYGYDYDPVLCPGVLTAEGRPGIEIYPAIGGAVGGDTAAVAELMMRLADGGSGSLSDSGF